MASRSKHNVIDQLGRAALLQLQAQGVDVTRQLRRLDQPGKHDTTSPGRHKYGVSPPEKRTSDGIVFASTLEMQAYRCLKQWGISFRLQPEFVLQEKFVSNGKKHREIRYVADFEIQHAGRTYIVDTKGVQTAMFKMKRKMLLKLLGIEVHCIERIGQLHELIFPDDKRSKV